MLGGIALAFAGAAPALAQAPAQSLPRDAGPVPAPSVTSTATSLDQPTSNTTSTTVSTSTATTSTTDGATTTASAESSSSGATTSASPADATPSPAASPAPPGAAAATGTSGATGPAASGSSAVTPDDGTLYASGPAQAGGASAPASAAASGGAQAPGAPGTIGTAASGIAASAATALPPFAFQGVLALTDPFASVADSVLGYFRIPLFLLPIYQAAGDQYGVPWPVLAAINEIETDYGHDLNVSPAGALGWMQFMPATWMQYGVDATASGVADPYNPADAVFAAARYLRDAGARTHLSAAIFSYNHSSAYVASVLLRAQLIEAYPATFIDSLTELSIGDTPVHDGDVRSVDYGPKPRPVRVPAPSTKAAAHRHRSTTVVPAAPLTLVTTPGARVLAVRDGRVVHEGISPALGGEYLTLRDADGNVFTYGHLSRRAVYGPEHPPLWHPLGVGATVRAGAVIGEVGGTSAIGLLRFVVRPAGDGEPVDPLPYLDSWALRAQTLEPAGATATQAVTLTGSPSAGGPAPATTPAPAVAPAAPGASAASGSVAASLNATAAAVAVRRARPAQVARARAASDLFTWGSTTIFFATAGQLEHAVLADTHLGLPRCERSAVSSHRVDRRVLAVLEFLSQSGFALGVDRSSCGVLPLSAGAARTRIATLDIASINGTPVAAHPGDTSLTALALARLRALYGEYVPQSLLDVAAAGAAGRAPNRPHELRVAFAVAGAPLAKPPSPGQAAAARVPALDAPLTTLEWSRVTARLAGIRSPELVVFPSASATVDRATAPHR